VKLLDDSAAEPSRVDSHAHAGAIVVVAWYISDIAGVAAFADGAPIVVAHGVT
jgi:hypothetical protein